MPSTYGRYGSGSFVGIQQTGVAVDGGQAVPELVGKTRGQLADAGERFLQPQLLLELHHFREIGEQADRRLQLPVGAGERRHAHAQIRRAPVQAQLAARDRHTAPQRVA